MHSSVGRSDLQGPAWTRPGAYISTLQWAVCSYLHPWPPQPAGHHSLSFTCSPFAAGTEEPWMTATSPADNAQSESMGKAVASSTSSGEGRWPSRAPPSSVDSNSSMRRPASFEREPSSATTSLRVA
eukprot:CAMPEP_0181214072 /NCGR_PEP_ID=MMETSP1096-20121128/25252_1 /TAXON_ID=156174 ORGANISM="Chrysochromulina ericina, Strain CCMP281" /NCGR_SAMPLE_ID=MMETSP1096 /ASSEMBLY_ACC=CAM_ASM_000453 /LENGTH=126 /DNA_ID=CAMNT_0023305771 /DNA_START=1199 /DNA_END=1579 /DNA_ORIENTATION=-